MNRPGKAGLPEVGGEWSGSRGLSATLVNLGEGDSQRYRCSHLAHHLERLGFHTRLLEFRAGERLRLGSCDLVVLHRIPADRFLLKECRRVQSEGGLVAVDVDDLVFDPREVGRFARDLAEPLARRVAVVGDARAIRTGIMAADLALAATRPLREALRGLCQRVEHYGNSYSPEMLRLSEEAFGRRRASGGEVVLGYASGTPTHALDFAGIVPVLVDLFARFPQVRLRIIGFMEAGGELQRFGDRIERRPFVPWRMLPGELADLDVNLVPLEAQRPFCRMKSEVKFLEAALVRVPTVADGTPAFRSAILDGENGFIPRDAGEWRERLAALIEAPELRRTVGERAYRDVVGGYSPEVRIIKLASILNNAACFDQIGAGRRVAPGNGVGAPASDRGLRVDPNIVPRRVGVCSKGMHFLRYEPPAAVLRRLLLFVLVRFSRVAGSSGRSPNGF